MSTRVSVVVPTFNKREYLELTLAAFDRQTFPVQDFELILVDDGSTDGTQELVCSLKSRYSLVYMVQPNCGRSAARNAGIRKAKGQVVIFNDAEALPDPKFVERHAIHHEASDPKVVIGAKWDLLSRWNTNIATDYLDCLERKFAISEDNMPELIRTARITGDAIFLRLEDIMADFERVLPYVFRRAPHNNDRLLDKYGRCLDGFSVPWVLFVTVNVSVRRDELLRSGLFDEDFAGWGMEDVELGYRLHKAGLHFVYDDLAANYHQMHPFDRALRKRELVRNYGLFCRKHPDIEVFLYHRRHAMGLDVFSEVVAQCREARELGHDYLLSDYRNACRGQAEQFIREAETVAQ